MTPRSSHAGWAPRADRPDPVALLEEQNADRLPWLVPVRHARMRVSPFTFFRGSARIMATDLVGTPTSGLTVQLGGDAHLSNFGAYASPERRLVFDQNDFDETLPGPWEWDLKRLATSLLIAGQNNGFSAKTCREITRRSVLAYRRAMAHFADMDLLQLWYDHIDIDRVREESGLGSAEISERVERFERRAVRKTSLQALAKLTEVVDGHHRIRRDPPVLLRLHDLPDEADPDGLEAIARASYEAYKDTLPDHHHHLLDRYDVVDLGVKVVGVGSVGTRCMLLLLKGRDEGDPLFLQAKEACTSVLEDHLPASVYANHGRRVVEGQRLVQAQSDSFLGWTEGMGGGHRHYYLRQLRDWKGSAEIETMSRNQLAFYAGLCGLTLARGHARSGDAESLRAYVGKSDSLDRAVTAFAEAYAQQNLEDFERFCLAITEGRLEVAPGI